MQCWGEGSNGQFGLQRSENVFTPVPGNVSVRISSVSCGEQHTLFLTGDGTVLSCGRNSNGQLGRERDKRSNLPARVEGLGDVVAVACGRDHSVAVRASGQVLSWGAAGEGQLGINLPEPCQQVPRPRPVLMPPQRCVVQVACGNSHSVAMTTGGDVWAWGLNSHGQLGLGKAVPLQRAPRPVHALTGVPVVQVAAGGSHTLILTLPGVVYCCGANQAGQLGLNRVDEKGRFNVCAVPALRPLGVSFISCGEAHSAVLTKDSRVFTFGDGSRGQLGHSSTTKELAPKLVEGYEGQASQIACGSHHTLVLGSSGQLWAFGSGVKGQLGAGSPQDSLRPTPVQLPWITGSAPIPSDLRVTAGWNSNFIYTADMESSRPERPVGMLDDAKLQKWLSMKTGDAESKREIALMFSTSSNLVASFTKVSESASGKTAANLTVDIEAASQVLHQLLNVPWIRLSVDLEPLVAQLCDSRLVLKSPEVVLLLPLCPLMHEEQNVMSLALPFAVALEQMREATLKTLKDWWSALSPSVMTKNILLWRNALNFLLRNRLLTTHNPGVKFLLKALKHLHTANRKAGKSQVIPISTFYVEEIDRNVDLTQDVKMWCNSRDKEDDDDLPAIFCRFPFALNLLCKITVFNYSTAAIKEALATFHELAELLPDVFLDDPDAPDVHLAPVFQLRLRRRHLVEDTFRQLGAADHFSFQRTLQVQFVEDMKVTLVNQKDFFLHVFEKLLAPESEMFMYNDRKTLVWFPSQPKLERKNYFLFGVLCGMALYNHNIVHLPFPLVLFKKLVNVKPSLDDMKEFDPILGGSLNYISEYEDEDLVNMDMTYSVFWNDRKVELDPQNSGKLVTSSNKKQFVDAYVTYAFNQSVESVFEEFKRGFYKVFRRNVVDFFHPEELRGVMVGTEDYDWEILRQNTVYDGEYHPHHPNILAFWGVFEELTADQKKAFLLFLTGCDRVPILGMDEIKMGIAVLINSTEHHFPESLTCHSLLLLPIYPSVEILQARLVEAINHNRGFWKE